jgi:hypothetical protein
LATDECFLDVDVLLRGLPALEQLALEGRMCSSHQHPAQHVRLSYFPAALQQLVVHQLVGYYLDAAALAACCRRSGLCA